MPLFRIHRMKEGPRMNFRWAPHTSGVTTLRPRDFEAAGEVEATGFYSAWSALRETGRGLDVGDLLESASGELRICKYVGLELGAWAVPEPKAEPPAMPSPAASIPAAVM
jgi:hypothetical protein